MSTNGETLQDLLEKTVRSWVAKGKATSEPAAFAAIAEASGGKVSRTKITNIVRHGESAKQKDVLEGIAQATGYSEKRVIAAARRSDETSKEPVGLVEFSELSRPNRDAVRALTKALLTAQRQSEDLAARLKRTEQAANIVQEVAQEAVDNGAAGTVSERLANTVLGWLNPTASDERRTGS